jgi:RND family efflux transporter MFP subunit
MRRFEAKQKASILLAGAVLLTVSCFRDKKSDAKLETKPLSVKTEAVKRVTLSNFLHFNGTVMAWKTANITPDASGRIGRILKKPGDRAQKGELLAQLDMTALELQVRQARAAAAVAEASHRDAKLNFERMKKMYENRAISQMQFEKAQLAFDSADTQLKSSRAGLDLVEYTLKNSYMRAPFDGIVTAKLMEEGDQINPMIGQGASILTLMDLSKVKVNVDVPAEEIEKIRDDQPCLVRVTSLGAETFTGRVYSKNLAADPMSKTFKVEIVIDNPGTRIKAGVYADIAIEVSRLDNALTLPLAALLPDDLVMVYDQGKAVKRTVTIGARNETRFEIASGLREGELVLVEGNYDLKDGTRVAIRESGK